MENVSLNTYRPLATQNARPKQEAPRPQSGAIATKESAGTSAQSDPASTAKSVKIEAPAPKENEAAKSEVKSVPKSLEQVLDQAANQIQNVLPDLGLNTQLRIRQDETSGRFIYQNIDRTSGEVVSQQPPEEVLNRVASVREVFGLVVDDEA